MIFAINLRTESGDGYLFLEEVNTETEMLAEIALAMGDELEYVYGWDIETIGGDKERMRDLLHDHIELMRNYSR